MASEISWTRRTEDGGKVQITARRFGGTWSFYTRVRRNEPWEALLEPPLEEWLALLEAVRRRVPRRLFPPDEVARIQQAIRHRFPESS
jgi:hypothetical protein